MRTSPAFRRALIIVPVVAVLVVGVISGREGDSGVTFSGAAGSPTDDAALAQWQADARPVLDEIEATRASVAEVIASGEPEEVVVQCRAAWQLVPGWTDALVPAPDPELDAAIRARLQTLNQEFGSCALGP